MKVLNLDAKYTVYMCFPGEMLQVGEGYLQRLPGRGRTLRKKSQLEIVMSSRVSPHKV